MPAKQVTCWRCHGTGKLSTGRTEFPCNLCGGLRFIVENVPDKPKTNRGGGRENGNDSCFRQGH
jgi:hypothetical protein